MEAKHVKGSNDPVKKTTREDGVPLLERKDSSDDPGKGGSLRNPSFNPLSNQNHESVSSPDSTPKFTHSSTDISAENEMQVSSQEPSEMKSPPTQTMSQQPPGYDPNRIPTSIFSSKPTNSEWSTASNESLFSIHMGNNSFSRDYAILFGKSGEFRPEDWNNGSQPNPFGKSGELPRLDEWNSQQSKPNELSSLPPVMEVPSHEENSLQSGEFSKIEKKDDNKSPNAAENHGNDQKPIQADLSSASGNRADVKTVPPIEKSLTSSSNTPTTFPSPPRFSDGSGHSGSSFAFPV